MTWKKGQSGNPKGRPPAMLAKTAKEHAIKQADKAFKALREIVTDKNAPHAARVSAASTILDRAYGKAPQDVTIKGQLEQQIIQLIQGLDEQPKPSVQSSEQADQATKH